MQQKFTILLEDTFLLLDALEQDALALRLIEPLVCLEVGCAPCTFGLWMCFYIQCLSDLVPAAFLPSSDRS